MDQGYHNTMFRVPSKEFKDFIEFQQQEVCALAKELVDIVHSYGEEADDVPGRPLDRHRALRQVLQVDRTGRCGWFRGQRRYAAHDLRH